MYHIFGFNMRFEKNKIHHYYVPSVQIDTSRHPRTDQQRVKL